MNESQVLANIQKYIEEITQQFISGQAREHAYRPALERLMSGIEDVRAVNDPARSENGNPDFVFLKASNIDIILGYAEAKDITVSVDKTLKTEQLRRYAGYEKLFLTNYLEFVFLRNGEEYERIKIGEIVNNAVIADPTQYNRLLHELQAFIDLPPEQIKSGKKLSIIMGGKARRIRDNVNQYLQLEGQEKNAELEKIYSLMKESLVHDLTKEAFADMYAQTLVYGLFAARYNDDTPDDFSRREAVENVPKSNPFLRKFFDHIAGVDFDPRLSHIVDELCDVFKVSDVNILVHKHLRLFELGDEKDPIIHFYEDFLKEYDPAERKRMGAYYTPMPVVQYIVRQVDRILKEDFGITKGLTDTSKVQHSIDHGQELQIRDQKTGRLTKTSIEIKELHRVQVLDPAVGTATFLNETIKHIRKDFDGQEGMWPSYVNEHLLPRLHGFELMMAPYTVAHLKLGITLQETGVKDISQRLGVYLTNSLEEGIPLQQDLFSAFGLASAVTAESEKASEIKHERPIMVVMGNPPYSGHSSNNTPYANSLVSKYKTEPGGTQKLQERNPKWLNDDYVKFMAFAEDMIAKNREGIVAMITNNGYLDNPTFRGMRWHLAKTFDKIYVLDLHGNSKKKETALDGGKDENIFDIQQGVSIMLALKTANKQTDIAQIYHADIYGLRRIKFENLANDRAEYKQIQLDPKYYWFKDKNIDGKADYEKGIQLNELIEISSPGIVTGCDSVLIGNNEKELTEQLLNLETNEDDIKNRFNSLVLDTNKLKSITYRPFDNKYIYLDSKYLARSRDKVMRNFSRQNIGLSYSRGIDVRANLVYVVDTIAEGHVASGLSYIAPLWVYHNDGTKTPNYNTAALRYLLSEMGQHTYTAERSDLAKHPGNFWIIAEDVFDYIYGVLHSPAYREKYKEFLKIDFPRIPKPQSPEEFAHYFVLGRELRDLHLMRHPDLSNIDTTYSIAGNNEVEKVVFAPGSTISGNSPTGSVCINELQYFGNVPEIAWNFYIGGYQPAQKWLKDRKGRKLSSDDIQHYQKIIKILTETNRIMQEIDKA
jgi:predicted helicase